MKNRRSVRRAPPPRSPEGAPAGPPGTGAMGQPTPESCMRCAVCEAARPYRRGRSLLTRGNVVATAAEASRGGTRPRVFGGGTRRTNRCR